jgi:translocation and assembly module TamB
VHLEELLPSDLGARAGGLEAGAARLTAELSGSLAEPAGTIELEARDLRRHARRLDELAARARLSPGWIELDRFRARTGEVVLEGEGAVSLPFRPLPLARAAGTARVEALRIARGELALELERPFELRLDPGRLALDELVLSGVAGRFEARAELVPARWRIELVGQELADAGLLTGWLPAGVGFADAEGSITVERDGAELAASVELDVPRLRWREDAEELALRARFTLEDRRLALDSLALDGGPARIQLQGSLPLDPLAWPGPEALPPGALELAAEVDLAALATPPLRALRGRTVAGDLRARFTLRGTWEAPELALELDSERLVARLPDPFAPELAGSLHARLAFDRALRVSELRAATASGERLDLFGEAALACEPRRWLAEGPPDPAEVALDLAARAELANLAFLASLLPPESRILGKVSGEGRVGGTAALPLVSGTLELSDGELRLPGGPAPFAGLRGLLELDEGRLTRGVLDGELGRGPFRISGSVDWSTPGAPGRIELHGERLLLARNEDFRLRADTDLVLEGPLAGAFGDERPRLTGTLDLRDGRSTQRLDLLQSLRRAGGRRVWRGSREIPFPSLAFEPLASAELDVRIGGDPIEIDSNLVQARLEPALAVSGTGRAPDLSGDLFVSRGAVLVPAGVVEIRSGSISFTRADPLVPRVDLVGEARLAGYDVTVLARGPYDDVEILLSSSPALEQSDVSLLLLSGRVPVAGQGPASRQTVQALATYLGRDLVSRFMDEEFEGTGTGLLSRAEILQGREVTQSGGQTTEVSVRLAPAEEGGKRAIHLRGEKDRYDRTNFGLRFTFRFP